MINPDNVWHVLPVDDIQPHIDKVTYPPDGMPYCDCPCKPTCREEGKDGFLVIHNSFDGREGVEWANEILDNNGKN